MRARCGPVPVLPVGVGDTASRGAVLLTVRKGGARWGEQLGAVARWEEQGLGDLGAPGETGSSRRQSSPGLGRVSREGE